MVGLLLVSLIFLSEQAALDHLAQRKDIDASKIVVFGRSLGGAVGAAVTRNNPDKVMCIVYRIFVHAPKISGCLVPF